MSYQRPGPTTTIIETGVNPTGGTENLNPCIVGPGFQVIDRGSAGAYDGTDATDYSIPDLLSTSYVMESTLHVYITNTADGVTYEIESDGGANWSFVAPDTITIEANVYWVISSGSDGSGTGYYFGDGSVDVADLDVLSGDILVIDPDGTPVEYTIAGIGGDYLLLTALYTSGAGVDWEIRRFLAGDVYISYHALRTDIVGTLLEFSDIDDLIDQAGGEDAIIPENPLYYGSYLALNQGAPCFATGVEDETGAFDPDDVSLTDWSAAFTFLRQFKYIYSYVICCQSDSVIALAQTFVDNMSLPANNCETRVFVASARKDEEVAIQDGSALFYAGTTVIGNTVGEGGDGKDLIIWGCEPGGYVEYTSGGTTVTARVQSVAQHTINLYTALPAGADVVRDFRYVNRYYTNTQEANAEKEYGEALADKRVANAWPATCGISVDGTLTEYPAYYLYCERVGKMAANPNPSQPYTRDTSDIITRVFMPFNDEDLLDIIASGGREVFYQTRLTLPVMSRHQLTTDMTNDARKEQSVVTQVDYYAKQVRSVVDSNIGKYVINDDLLNALTAAVTAKGNYLTKKKRYIGGARLLWLRQSTDDPTRVDVACKMTPLYPYNGPDIIIYV